MNGASGSRVMLRPLTQAADSAQVLDLYTRAADYALLEDGRPPDAAMVAAFFTDCPPGGDPRASVKLGADHGGRLVGIADLAFGYPMAQDAYIGLLLLDPALRGQGLGAVMVARLDAMARAQGANRLLVAVLEANPRGLAFWQRCGFAPERHFPAAANDPMRHSRLRLTRKVSPLPK